MLGVPRKIKRPRITKYARMKRNLKNMQWAIRFFKRFGSWN